MQRKQVEDQQGLWRGEFFFFVCFSLAVPRDLLDLSSPTRD